MSVKIKICGITRAEDAETLVRLGVDALGLVFYPPSPRYVCPEKAGELSRAVEGKLLRVGVFVDAPAATVGEAVERVGLDVLQFQGAETPDFCASFGLPYLRAFRVAGTFDHEAVEARYPEALAIHLDASVPGLPGGTGHRFNWRQWPERPGLNYMLAGGLTPENVGTAVERLRPWGVDVSTGVESPVKGVKDAGRMSRFVAEVRRAEIG
ncbi:MAG: phosphoribosylanthranilate isomerase [Gammaproteobacteria bacterium]|nr:phosphoribosylanthranilate isomerase [Gammaproteobacteria bacterium]